MNLYYLHTEKNSDLVRVYNSGGSLLATYSGYNGTISQVVRVINSPWLRIRFTSNTNLNVGAGLKINFTQGTSLKEN